MQRRVRIMRNTAKPWPRFAENEIAVLDVATAEQMVLRGLAIDIGPVQPVVASPAAVGPEIEKKKKKKDDE